jgi:hypothetical protein
VALAGHFYSAWRQARQERRTNSAFAAGIALLLRRMLQEAEANYRMYIESRDVAVLGDDEFTITRPLSGVKALTLPCLHHEEALLLLQGSNKAIAPRVDNLISVINLNNLAIEEYSSRRKEFISISDEVTEYITSCEKDGINENHTILRRCRSRLEDLSSYVSEMTERTYDILVECKSIIDEFNSLVKKGGVFAGLHLQYSQDLNDLLRAHMRREAVAK